MIAASAALTSGQRADTVQTTLGNVVLRAFYAC
jgi:hypothetical protein